MSDHTKMIGPGCHEIVETCSIHNCEMEGEHCPMCAVDDLSDDDLLRVDGIEWTTTPPTKPGWYWWRHDEGERPRPQRLPMPVVDGIGLLDYGEWWPERIKEPGND